MVIKNNYILALLSVLAIIFTQSCEKDYVKENSTETSTDDDSDNDNSAGMHEDSADYVWDTADVIPITLKATSIEADNAGVTISGTTATITAAGTYSITGSLTNGQIVVNTTDEGTVRLLLNGISVSNSSTSPLYISKGKKVVVYLEENTVSTLSDATTYTYPSSDTDEPNAAFFSKANLTIFGAGELVVKGNYLDGITSKDGLIIKGGTIRVTAKDDGIRGKDYLITKKGIIVVNSGGDALKSSNADDTALGYISLSSDSVNITSSGDGITAQTNTLVYSGSYTIISGGGSTKSKSTLVSTKGLKGDASVVINGGKISVSSSDDCLHSEGTVTINDGTLKLASADQGINGATSVTMNKGTLSITQAREGIESPTITMNDGDISIIASDDAFNASKGNGGENSDGSLLSINGGYIYISPTTGDGLDSNGSISITGGTVIDHGPKSNPELAIDYNGTCNITGGFLIASGIASNMTQGASTTSTQYSLKLIFTSTFSASTIFHIQDKDGNDLVTFKPANGYSSMVFSSPQLKSGSTYNIYTGGSSTGTLKNGLYQGGTYTPGTLYTSFTISSMVTSIGSSSSGGGSGPRG